MAQKRITKKRLKKLKAREENAKRHHLTTQTPAQGSVQNPTEETLNRTISEKDALLPIPSETNLSDSDPGERENDPEEILDERLETIPSPSLIAQAAVKEIPVQGGSQSQGEMTSINDPINLSEATQESLAQKVSKPFLEFSRKLREKIIAPRKASPAEEEFRKSLVGLSNRLKVTTDVIQQNSQSLTQLAGENEDVASLLKKLQDKRLLEVQDRLVKGMEIFPEQARDLVQTWSELADNFKTLGISLGFNFDDLIRSAQTLIKDQRIDITTRRKILDQIVAEGRAQKLNPKILEDINKNISEGLNFSTEQIQQTDSLLEALKIDASGRRIRGTLDGLSKKFDSMLFNQESLNDIMKTQSENGEKMLDSFLKKGLGAVGPEAKKGLFQLLLSYLGLNGLDDVVGALFDVASIGTGVKAFGGKAKGLFGKIFGSAEGKGASALAGGVSKKGLFSRLFSRAAPTVAEAVPGAIGLAEKASPAAEAALAQAAEKAAPGFFSKGVARMSAQLSESFAPYKTLAKGVSTVAEKFGITRAGSAVGKTGLSLLSAGRGVAQSGIEKLASVAGSASSGLGKIASPVLEKVGVGIGSAKSTAAMIGKLGGSAAETVGGALAGGIGSVSRGASRLASPVLGALGKTGKFLLKGGGGPLAGLITAGQKLYEGQGVGKAVSGGIGSAAGTAMGGTLGSFLGPVGTFAGAVIGGMAGEWISDHVYDFFAKGGASKMLSQIQDLFSGSIAWMGKTASSVIEALKSGASNVFEALKSVSSQISKIASSVSKWIGASVWTPLKQGFDSLFGEDGLFSKAFNFIRKFIGSSSIGKFFESFGSSNNLVSENGSPEMTPKQGLANRVLNFVMGSATTSNPLLGLLGNPTSPALAQSGGMQEIPQSTPTRTILGQPTAIPAKLDTRSNDLAVEDAVSARRIRAEAEHSAPRGATVLPIPQSQQNGVNRITTIDDTGLHLINHGMLE